MFQSEVFPIVKSPNNKYLKKYAEEIGRIDMLVNHSLSLIAISINSLSEYVSVKESDDRTYSETTMADTHHHYLPESALELKTEELIEFVNRIKQDLRYVDLEFLTEIIMSSKKINHIATCLAGKCLLKVLTKMDECFEVIWL